MMQRNRRFLTLHVESAICDNLLPFEVDNDGSIQQIINEDKTIHDNIIKELYCRHYQSNTTNSCHCISKKWYFRIMNSIYCITHFIYITKFEITTEKYRKYIKLYCITINVRHLHYTQFTIFIDLKPHLKHGLIYLRNYYEIIKHSSKWEDDTGERLETSKFMDAVRNDISENNKYSFLHYYCYTRNVLISQRLFDIIWYCKNEQKHIREIINNNCTCKKDHFFYECMCKNNIDLVISNKITNKYFA